MTGVMLLAVAVIILVAVIESVAQTWLDRRRTMRRLAGDTEDG